MPPKNLKKGQKVDLNTFLADADFGGDWADDFNDAPAASRLPPTTGLDSMVSRPREREMHSQYMQGGRSSAGGYGGGSNMDRPRFNDRPKIPIPDHPPFTAYVGNLAFEVAEPDLESFFGKQNVVGIRLAKNDEGRSRGFSYVEFGDRQSLVDALDATGANLLGRNVRIDVAEPQQESRGNQAVIPEGEWRRASDAPSRGSRNNNNNSSTGSRYSSGSRFENDSRTEGQWGRKSDSRRSTSGSNYQEPQVRKKLNLEPRTKPIEEVQPAAAYAATDDGKSKSNPFGSAVPRDENEILRKIEEKRVKREEEEKAAKEAKREEARIKREEEKAKKEEESKKEAESKKDDAATTKSEESKTQGHRKSQTGKAGHKEGEDQKKVLDTLPQTWRRGPSDKAPSSGFSSQSRRQSERQVNGNKDRRQSQPSDKKAGPRTPTSSVPQEPDVDKAGFQSAANRKDRRGTRDNGKPQVYEKETVDVSSKNAFDLLNEDN